MNIIFMGTAEFGLPALKALINSRHNVKLVYTAPPKPAGRGKKERRSPIHDTAAQHNIETLTPKSLRKETINADFVAVAAYGLLLPENVLNACPCLNIHPSKLPRWRGAAPIQRTIIAGDEKTAIAIMKMDKGLDTGDILMEEEFTIPPKMNARQLHDETAEIGARLLLKAIDNYENITSKKQSEEGVTYAKKLTKDEYKIDWNKPAIEIERLIRGVYPYAYFMHGGENGERVKILEADVVYNATSGKPGKILNKDMLIACKDAALQPKILQRQGKKPMELEVFLHGFRTT